MISIYDEFVKDYNNPNMTGEDIRRINHINSHQYSKLRQKALSNGDISVPRRMNTTGAKFYTKTKTGDFIVKKQFGHETILVGRFSDEKTAKMIVSLCKSVNWNLSEISDIIEENKVKPKNYTFINGYYTIEKTIGGERIVFYRSKDESLVIRVVNELRKNDWDKSKVNLILDEMSLN